MTKQLKKILLVTLTILLVIPFSVLANNPQAPDVVVPVTILHTNDFHGRLETDSAGRGGAALLATAINQIRTDIGADNVVLFDAGDVALAGPPISQLLEGESTVDIFNTLGYDLSVLGNHEFDLGLDVLQDRVTQATFPWLGANVINEGTIWEHPTWIEPYTLVEVGTGANSATIGVIGLAAEETPVVTLLGTTEGLEFLPLDEAILHYYDEVMALADVLVVVAHMGTEDSGPYQGLETIAQTLIDAGKPVDLMIGGHQHQALETPVVVGDTTIVSAGQYGRYLGRVDATIDTDTNRLTVVDYELITINTTNFEPDPTVAAQVAEWAELVAPIVNQPVTETLVPLTRNYNGESLMGDIVTDAMLWKANQLELERAPTPEEALTVDIAFTNPGGLRADIPENPDAEFPYAITWGDTFNVLPFGNTLVIMDLTGAQIQEILDQSASLFKGILQVSGLSYYWENNTGGPDATEFRAYNVMVNGEPLDPARTYRVVTNNFLATGGDDWVTFAEGVEVYDTFYDMQEAFVEYLQIIGPVDEQDIQIGRILQEVVIYFPWILVDAYPGVAPTTE